MGRTENKNFTFEVSTEGDEFIFPSIYDISLWTKFKRKIQLLYFAVGDILIIKYRNEQNDPLSFLVFNYSTANKKMHENICKSVYPLANTQRRTLKYKNTF